MCNHKHKQDPVRLKQQKTEQMTVPKTGKAPYNRQDNMIIVHMIPSPHPVTLWGLSPQERLRRQLHDYKVVFTDGTMVAGDHVLIVDESCLYDQTVLDWLLEAPGRAIDAGHGRAAFTSLPDKDKALQWVSGVGEALETLKIASLDAIGQAHNQAHHQALRKREAPYCLKLEPDTARLAERHLFSASYKGVTDLVTKYVWPWPAFHVARLCARLGIIPNMVTLLGAGLVVIAFWLFWQGHFVSGLMAAWGMTFLDTVDGKLARTTLTSSSWGHVLDHGMDLIHPPFWYWAWAHGLGTITHMVSPDRLSQALWLIIGGYIMGRLMEGFFIARHKMELHVWRRFDSFFRAIVARRNPNLILLSVGVLLGRPDLGFIWVAVWTGVSLLVHLIQILQAEQAARTRPLRSWLHNQPTNNSA